ncbi:conserved hypothetical protein [Culex quinquefasciatus]|uniref:MD-2-related lipid-recognition domain-containing protein n=1 Tax=Culex quinquefasciatus TaxID=7176 RepID=B0WTI2_CULQU|nr:conserved hypothetical protein [Culex quinquefasciatus]|eukprot:XP_001854108.1 conserved hypothetical protein [Culex quinquefasciatus]
MVANRLILSLLVAPIAIVASIQVMFEQVSQCTSNGVLDCNLRVRKLNRTLATLYGNVTLNEDLGNNFITSFNLYRSWLGNNQYNLYPMRVSPTGICNFMEKFWADYYPYVVVYVPQMEKPGVCPITARQLQFNDMVLDARILPRYAPTGLWKLVWRAEDNRTGKNFLVEIVFRVYPDGH